MVYSGDKPTGDWTDSLDDKKTCPVAFCLYPEQECEFGAINVGAVDSQDFVWLEGAEKCREIELQDHAQVEDMDDEVNPLEHDPIVEPYEIDDMEPWTFQRYVCPMPHCSYTDVGLVSADDLMQHAFNEHWNEQHG